MQSLSPGKHCAVIASLGKPLIVYVIRVDGSTIASVWVCESKIPGLSPDICWPLFLGITLFSSNLYCLTNRSLQKYSPRVRPGQMKLNLSLSKHALLAIYGIAQSIPLYQQFFNACILHPILPSATGLPFLLDPTLSLTYTSNTNASLFFLSI